jgi:hypothetical protein
MNMASFEDENLDILQNIDIAINAAYKENRSLTDYEVDSALEALLRTYSGEAGGKPPVLPRNPLSLKVYENVRDACDIRLGKKPLATEGKKTLELEPVPMDLMLKCLKRVRKSVQYWNKQSGTRGYLDYIRQFTP